MTKLEAAILVACTTCVGSVNASSWWNNDDYYDRWYDGPWYGGYPGYGWGGYPGYGWGGYGGYGDGRTIIVYPQISDSTSEPEPQVPR